MVDRLKKRFEKKLTFLLYGMKGGDNRIKIIEALKERPYNMNQLSTKLGLNYRTIKHHIDKLIKEELLSTAKKGKYGNVFFLSPELEANMDIYDRIVNKINRLDYLQDYVNEIHFYPTVIKQMSVGVIMADNENNIFFFNPAASGIFGYAQKEVLDAKVPEIQAALFQDKELNKTLKKRPILRDYVKEISDRNGTQRFINITTSPIKSPEGEPIGRSYILQDITRKKLDEDRIRHLQELSQAIFDNIPLGINIKDKKRMVSFQNRKMDEMFGQISDKKCFEHYWNRKKPCKDCEMIAAYKNGEVHSIIGERENDRTYLIIQVPFEGDKVMEIIQDITEEKMFEKELLNTKNLFNDFMDHISDHMVIVNVNNMEIETANKAFVKSYSKSGKPEEIIGMKCHEVMHRVSKPDEAPEVCPILRTINKKKSRTLKHKHFDKNGKEFEVTISYYPIVEHDGTVERIIILMLPSE